MKILVLNCGSSSLKYQVLEMGANENTLLAKGLVERIGSPNACHTHKVDEREDYKVEKAIANHTEGIKSVLDRYPDRPCIRSPVQPVPDRCGRTSRGARR